MVKVLPRAVLFILCRAAAQLIRQHCDKMHHVTAKSLECVCEVDTHEKDARADRPDPWGERGETEVKGAGEGRDKSDAARPAAPDVELMM